MTRFKEQKIVRCHNIKELNPDDVDKITISISKDRAFRVCNSDLVKDSPFALTIDERNFYILWV